MSTQLPQYRCHKIVGAALILAIAAAMPADTEGNANANAAFVDSILTLRTFDEEHLEVRRDYTVDAGWMAKNRPEVGGYFVEYEGGYTSYSPAPAFEGGYRLLADVLAEEAAAEKHEEDMLAEIIASVRAEERQRMLDELAAKTTEAASVDIAGSKPPPAERTKWLTFGEALRFLEGEKPIARAAWPGGVRITLDEAPSDQHMRPINMRLPDGLITPYVADQIDLRAADWFVVFPA